MKFLLTHLIFLKLAELITLFCQELDNAALEYLKFLKVAVNGAFFQSVLIDPPLVAQLSASQSVEYNLIGCFLGKATPTDSMFLKTLMAIPSTKNLKKKKN